MVRIKIRDFTIDNYLYWVYVVSRILGIIKNSYIFPGLLLFEVLTVGSRRSLFRRSGEGVARDIFTLREVVRGSLRVTPGPPPEIKRGSGDRGSRTGGLLSQLPSRRRGVTKGPRKSTVETTSWVEEGSKRVEREGWMYSCKSGRLKEFPKPSTLSLHIPSFRLLRFDSWPGANTKEGSGRRRGGQRLSFHRIYLRQEGIRGSKVWLEGIGVMCILFSSPNSPCTSKPYTEDRGAGYSNDVTQEEDTVKTSGKMSWGETKAYKFMFVNKRFTVILKSLVDHEEVKYKPRTWETTECLSINQKPCLQEIPAILTEKRSLYWEPPGHLSKPYPRRTVFLVRY